MIGSPVDKGTLGVHEVKLVVEPRPSLCDGRGVAQHADAPDREYHLETDNLCSHLGTLARSPPGTTVGGW